MSSQRVVKIDFFTEATLPEGLRRHAIDKGVQLGKGIVVVKTIIGSPPSYDFISIGNKPAEIRAFVEQLAREDGAELGVAVRKAFRKD